MSTSPNRLVWFDANRVMAAFGVVLIHSTTDFGGQPFAEAEAGARLIPVFLRSLGEFSGSEMFFFFSLFLMALRLDRKMPSYGTAIAQQARNLLVPFVFWVVFYAFYRLLKAEAFHYTDYIWNQVTTPANWLGYFVLGDVQYHMHFLPTLFALFLFFPVMRAATRYPVLGLVLVLSLGVLNTTQGFIWSLGLEESLRDYVLRGIKVLGYVGYGFAAFALFGFWKDGIPRGESRLLRRCGLYLAALAYVATLPFFAVAVETGSWGIRGGWDYFGHFLMPICVFLIFLGGQHLEWSARWSRLAKYTFGVYLVHPAVIDLYDIALFTSGLWDGMAPAVIVLGKFCFAVPVSFAVAVGLSKISVLAWTIGLGPTPWEARKPRVAKA